MSEPNDILDKFLAFADAVQAHAEQAHRPAYAETCGGCNGSVEVGRDVSRADLRRIRADFIGRHWTCLPRTPEADHADGGGGDD